MQNDIPNVTQLVAPAGGGVHQLKKGDTDPIGDKVGKIYVRTDRFIIYTADEAAKDFGRLRYLLTPTDYEECRSLRKNLCPVNGPITLITDVVCGLKPRGFGFGDGTEAFESFAERCLALMAKSMQMAFEGNADRAEMLLQKLREDVESRRDSGNRMRYIFANATALLAIILVWAVIRLTGAAEAGIVGAFFSGSAASGDAPPLSYLDVMMLGALGAFFSVSVGLRDVRVSHSITLAEMLYAGFVRVPTGIIAALVVILLISGGWILGALAAEYRPWSYYLFGFIAGFSELFVPNTLKQVEAGTRAEHVRPKAYDAPTRATSNTTP